MLRDLGRGITRDVGLGESLRRRQVAKVLVGERRLKLREMIGCKDNYAVNNP